MKISSEHYRSNSVFQRHERLRLELLQKLGLSPKQAAPESAVDVVISHGEINNQHGTGSLVKRILPSRGVFSIRFRDDWGIHDFGEWSVRLGERPRSRPDFFRAVSRILAGRSVSRVVAIPFTADQILTAIAVKEIFGARLCLWIMDDQNIARNSIPDDVMRECLEKCSLRLTTHPELRDAYRRKFGLPTWILPAVVPAHLVATRPTAAVYDAAARRGALLGSFWDQSWFERLSNALEPCNYAIDWFGQNRSPWLEFQRRDLDRAGIRPLGILPEERLAEELRNYPFVMVPCGALDHRDRNVAVAALSLPGRILFAAAASHTPLLIVGSERTCGARFVRHFGIGTVSPYESKALAAAMEHLLDPRVQESARRNAAAIAPRLSDEGAGAWLDASIEKGGPADPRFENLFSGYNAA